MRVLAGVAGIIAMVAASCGGASASFPEESECPAPAPLATVRNQPGVVSTRAYVTRLRASGETLERLRADLRGKYPEDTFYRRDGFRADFATYADQTVCAAQGMIDLTAPDARFASFDATLDTALADLIAHTRAGRAAVRARNVSEYRDWYRGVDARIAAVRNAVGSQP